VAASVAARTRRRGVRKRRREKRKQERERVVVAAGAVGVDANAAPGAPQPSGVPAKLKCAPECQLPRLSA
jgi:hypothetical protein